jgi:hypothetical protein
MRSSMKSLSLIGEVPYFACPYCSRLVPGNVENFSKKSLENIPQRVQYWQYQEKSGYSRISRKAIDP